MKPGPDALVVLCNILSSQGQRHILTAQVVYDTSGMPASIYISYTVDKVLVDSLFFDVDTIAGSQIANPDTALKYAQPHGAYELKGLGGLVPWDVPNAHPDVHL